MQSINQARSALHEDRQEISQRYAEVQQVEQEKQREEKRITGLQDRAPGQAASWKKERAKHEAAMKESRRAEKSLAALIRRLETQRRTEPGFRAAVRPSRKRAAAYRGRRAVRWSRATACTRIPSSGPDREQGDRYRRRLGRGGPGGRGRQGRPLGLAHGLWELRDPEPRRRLLHALRPSRLSVRDGRAAGRRRRHHRHRGRHRIAEGHPPSLRSPAGRLAMDPESWLGRRSRAAPRWFTRRGSAGVAGPPRS